ncbi:MAG: substrate-binding domain-containing protein, partial [Salinibacterium sp.]|nr:substrate-binding domain-containing protein [Salinibacterium sp.]
HGRARRRIGTRALCDGSRTHAHRARLDKREGAQFQLSPESKKITLLEVPCTRLGGARAFLDLWRTDVRPTAIVAFSDIIALGVLDAARDASVSMPAEVSVSGFDDLAEAAWAMPTLTTVRQPIESKGRLAAEFLVKSISADDNSCIHQQRLYATVLVRDSTGPVPRGHD